MFSSKITDKITPDELKGLHEICLESIRAGQLYTLRNDAKLRAVNNTKSYDEFKDIVDASHLVPVSKFDKNNAKTKNRLWNTAAREEDD